MSSSILLGVIAGPLLFLACIFELITLRHSSYDDRPIVKNGKKLMAAGFLLAALRIWFLPYFPVPLGIISYIFMAIGSMLISFDCIIRVCEEERAKAEREREGDPQQ